MTTNTAASNPAARQDPRQVVNTLRKTINFNDPGIAAGVAFSQALPQGAQILGAVVEIVTAFNAATTNVLTVGTNSADFNNIVNAADVNEAAVGATQVLRGIGGALARAADTVVYAKYAQTGTAATAGQAIVTIYYEGGWPN
jgi:hypothetical protein